MVGARLLLSRAGPALAAALAVASCSSGPVVRTDVGTVVDVLSASVCLDIVGLPLPRCYAADAALVADVQLGECVRITANVGFGRVAVRRATAIEPVSDDSAAGACPAPSSP